MNSIDAEVPASLLCEGRGMGQSERLYNRSLECLYGQGAAKDPVRAFELNAQAAALGFHDAVLAMGWFYLNGIGVEQDESAAETWYRKSARQGDERAMFSLGQMAYRAGDFVAAKKWFERAVEHGHDRSTFWIGKMHWRGLEFPADRKKAMQLFQLAAEKGVAEAKRTIKWLNHVAGRARARQRP